MYLTIAWTFAKVVGVVIIVVALRILVISLKIKAQIARLTAQGIKNYPGNEAVFGPVKNIIE